jgi:hypothetical protein
MMRELTSYSPVFHQRLKTAVVGFLSGLAKKAGGELAVSRMVGEAGAALPAPFAGIGAGTGHGGIEFTRHTGLLG